MAITDWFKEAKEKAEEAKEKKKLGNRYGNQGAGNKAYADAADALDQEEKPSGGAKDEK